MSSMGVLLIGSLILLVGLIYGASVAGETSTWVVVGALSFPCLGVMLAVSLQQEDPPIT